MPSLFQLATRSLCSSHRCVPPGLVRKEGLCQPTVPGWEGSVPSTNSGGTGDTNCTTQPWYPLLLSGHPYLIDNPVVNQGPSLNPQLAAWSISGRHTETRSFRRKLPLSCSNRGERRPMTHSLGVGIAGVVNGKQIPFRVL